VRGVDRTYRLRTECSEGCLDHGETAASVNGGEFQEYLRIRKESSLDFGRCYFSQRP
jgi:hypothetical protein